MQFIHTTWTHLFYDEQYTVLYIFAMHKVKNVSRNQNFCSLNGKKKITFLKRKPYLVALINVLLLFLR